MGTKVSVIIPVYNTEVYLNDCLDSIINQTHKDLEIICINDGSSDKSGAILENFKQKDDRIIIINQNNQGQSSARNKGLDIAKGDYILFVDSDDRIDVDFVEKMLSCQSQTQSDIVAASILRVGKNLTKKRLFYDTIQTASDLKEKFKICNLPKCCYVCAKLYKKELFNNLRFEENVFFEDIIFLPKILEKSNILSTVNNTNYYYTINPNSTVKKIPDKKKQKDAYNAKKFFIQFAKEKGIDLSKKDKTIVKSIKYFFNIPLIKTKEYENNQTSYLFGLVPIFKKTNKLPVIKENTFFVWEPCSKSHSEVVPGYCKYLLDLGYHVSVFVNPDRIKEGLFCRFKDKNLSINSLSQKETKQFFKDTPFDKNIKGVMVTTVGKICDCIHYDQAYNSFFFNVERNKILMVEHESLASIDKGTWKEDIITLRKLNYKNAKSTVVNPHYFGDIKISQKNKTITNFISIGALKANKLDSNIIIEAAQKLVNKNITNFKITIVGKGNLKHLPKQLRKYFDIKGRLPFNKMYDEIEKADFMLSAYSKNNPKHQRYNTTGTSGNFQLVYGFLKPCIILEEYAKINGFNNENSILYKEDDDYCCALKKAIDMDENEYQQMQNKLKEYTNELYQESLQNLKGLINE